MEPQHLHALIDDTLNVSTMPDDLPGWIVANALDCRYLLAHVEDGVIWGKLDSGRLNLTADAQPARLDAATLWQCRIFGPKAEVLLWRGDGAWHARKVTDQNDAKRLALDETQVLWGTQGTVSSDGQFTALQDGAQGLCHAVPVVVPTEHFGDKTNPRPVRLLVRHYVEEDKDTGVSRITLSRLVDLTLA